MDSDKPGTQLQVLTTHPGWVAYYGRWHTHLAYGPVLRWHPLCTAPCSTDVPGTLVYRVSGPTVAPSDDFTLGPGGERVLHVEGGSRSGQAGGAVALALGIPTAIVGVVLIAAGPDTRTAGYVTGGIGFGLIAAGAVLLATTATHVTDEQGRSFAKGQAPRQARGKSGPPPVKFGPNGLIF
jgi:hypothetical protein